MKANPGRLDACGEQQRWTERNDGRDEGGDKYPDDHPMQKRACRPENRDGASSDDGEPHPAHYDQMREEHPGKPQPQRAGRPSERTADSVESVESNQRTTPDGEARGEPP